VAVLRWRGHGAMRRLLLSNVERQKDDGVQECTLEVSEGENMKRHHPSDTPLALWLSA
jgi:hypothetical protein